MDVFGLLSEGRLDALETALKAEPGLAKSRHAGGASLLMWAAYSGKPDAIPVIRARLDEIDVYEAIAIGDIQRVRAALGTGWDGNALSPDGFTPLALAAFFNRSDIFDLLLPLTHNVSQPANNPQQVAALHAATAMHSAPMVEKLLRAGADPDQPQADGFTALHVAAQHGDTMIVGLLLLFGARRDVPNARGKTAAAHAEAGNHQWLATLLR